MFVVFLFVFCVLCFMFFQPRKKKKWEQVAPCPLPQSQTILICMDDTSPLGFVVMYVGTKASSGTEFEKAGLSNVSGAARGLIIQSWTEGVSSDPSGHRFTFTTALSFDGATTTAQTATELQTAGASLFARPEDGHWLSNGTSFFFVTSGSSSGPCRIWMLVFDDIANPLAGGVVSILATQTSVPYYDNIALSTDEEYVFAQTDGPSPR